MSRCSLWLTSHPGRPAVYICSAEMSVGAIERIAGGHWAALWGETEKKEEFFRVFLKLNPFDSRVQELKRLEIPAFSGTGLFHAFEAGTQDHCERGASARPLSAKWRRLRPLRQWSHSRIPISPFIPGQLQPLPSLISQGATKLNYEYNHLAAVSLPVCLSALHIECACCAGTLCWPIYYNGHCSTGGVKCTFPHNGCDCNEVVKAERAKNEGRRKKVDKRH